MIVKSCQNLKKYGKYNSNATIKYFKWNGESTIAISVSSLSSGVNVKINKRGILNKNGRDGWKILSKTINKTLSSITLLLPHARKHTGKPHTPRYTHTRKRAHVCECFGYIIYPNSFRYILFLILFPSPFLSWIRNHMMKKIISLLTNEK